MRFLANYNEMARYWNHFFSNGIFIVVMVALLFKNGVSHKDFISEPTSNRIVCADHWSCTNCTNASPCSWSINKQKCYVNTVTANLTENLMVTHGSLCPNFTVETSRKAGCKAMVTISNDRTGFTGLLKKSKLVCQIDDDYFNAKVDKDIIYCSDELAANKTLVRNINDQVKISYLSVIFDENRLVFDNLRQHYVKINNGNVCGKVSCKACNWNDYHNMVHCVRCSANDTCPKSREYQYCDIRNLSDQQMNTKNLTIAIENTCNIVIRSFEPVRGPWTEATNIRIDLYNHTMLFNNDGMPVEIAVAGQNCFSIKSFGNGTVSCKLQPNGKINSMNEGPVIVTFQAAKFSRIFLKFQSDSNFQFLVPKITNLEPTCGSAYRSTQLTINGEFFGSKNESRVMIADNVSCKIEFQSENQVKCITGTPLLVTNSNQLTNKTRSMVPNLLSGRVKLIVDNYSVEYKDTLFRFVADPMVTSGQNFSGFVSGGTNLLVRGQSFSCLTKAKICIGDSINCVRHYGGCQVLNDTYMSCLSPKFEPVFSTQKIKPIRFQAYYHKDVKPVEFILPPDSAPFHLYPDPIFVDFTMDGCCNVTINGLNLGIGYTTKDLSVRLIDNSTVCFNISMTTNQISCEFPPSDPYSHDNISITIGNSLTTYIVTMKLTQLGYFNSITFSNLSPIVLIIANSIFAFIVLFCLVVFGMYTTMKYDLLTSHRRQQQSRPIVKVSRNRKELSKDDHDELLENTALKSFFEDPY
ncbi:IPT domain,Immunoglobulin E-set,Immunoglobulin-like fold [Cinara cedri]|uniref:IPT domain,Immunoglobulin E-set,Immunoglobulin-like fold n=1 Tax=Cinara cedri TaxID=506608 RepID=A0A5E4MZ51_9HEMI|nr:IPT domain,Immunoglobulin E-set,Immunoglobulin-like fold [Cinara cedri]